MLVDSSTGKCGKFPGARWLAWLRLLDNAEIPFRFDVVEVIADGKSKPRCELIQDAFQLSAPYIY